jgi:hypothetical protein
LISDLLLCDSFHSLMTPAKKKRPDDMIKTVALTDKISFGVSKFLKNENQRNRKPLYRRVCILFMFWKVMSKLRILEFDVTTLNFLSVMVLISCGPPAPSCSFYG